jgi:carotenoid cleavage dioxygenase-like enzyme
LTAGVTDTDTLPFHLRGNFAPVREELTALDLPVRGRIPAGLNGRFLRNGPNPRSGTSPHWFFGDGMIHGVRLEEGRAAWYRNRWVRTRALEGESYLRPDFTVDLSVGVANTHIVCHSGRLYALVESSLPTELTPELETVGVSDMGGRLATAMTAHPKVCPVTGELHFFGYGFMPPFLTYHRADAAGTLVESRVIEVPGPAMIHDFAITRGHVVFLDLPVVFDLAMAMRGTMPFTWSDSHGARIGVMPRDVPGAPVRWFDIEPCYVFHTLNAHDDGSTVVVDAVRYPELWRDGPDTETYAPSTLHRWTVDLEAGRVAEQQLDDRRIEFPRVDERRTGMATRYGYALEGDAFEGAATALVRYDLAGGATERHDFGPGRSPGEAVFAPSEADAEDAGWLLTYLHDAATDSSELVILDAADISAPPVASIALPQRVPFGFHGSWVPDS